MSCFTSTRICALAGFCFLLVHGATARDAQANDREQISKRLGRLSNLTVEYDRVTRYDPDPNFLLPPEAKGHVKPPVPHTETFGERVELRAGGLLFWSERSKADCDAARAARDPISRVEATVITPGRGESLTWSATSKRASGSIADQKPIPIHLAIDMALGLRLEASKSWLSADDPAGGAILPSADPDRVVLQYRSADGTAHSFTLSRRNDYAVEQYHVDYPRPGEFEDFVCSDFRRVDGVMMPFRIERQSTYNDTSGKPRHPIVTTLTVRRYVLGDPAAAGTKPLALAWPKGTSVLDMRNHLILEVQNDGELLTDERIFAVIKEQELKQKELEDRAAHKIKEINGNPGDKDKARNR